MPRFKILILLFAFFCINKLCDAQNVVIKGNAPTYAGERIYIYSYTDYITKNEEDLGFFDVDEDGNFTTTIYTEDTKPIYLSLFANKGFFYIEPYTEYEILLPPKQVKEVKEKLNPYFIEPEIHLGVLNTWKHRGIYEDNELNHLIYDFDYSYDIIYNEFIIKAFNRNHKIKTDTIIHELKKILPTTNNEFFENYKKYKIGYFIYAVSFQNVKKTLISEYFNNSPILYNNPVYMDLFHETFDNYIYTFNNFKENEQIENALSNKKYQQLIKAISFNNILTNDSLKELVLLKEIHDGLYSGFYPKNILIRMLDSLFFYTNIAEHKYIAQNIREKNTRLLPGFSPPIIKLKGEDDKIYNFNDFKGKYLYINFSSVQSLACLKEFGVLDSLQKKYKDYLQVITISIDDNFKDAIYYKNKKHYKWKLLHYQNDPRIIKKYNIKAYPTYFLINPEGKLVMSPAPSPTQDFEYKFFQELRSKGIL